MVFSEDSYNTKHTAGGRVLVGNWREEAVLQETVGEARSVPQRHIKRSGLLKDFTKRPGEVRILDNTFERVSGSSSASDKQEQHTTTNSTHFQRPTQPIKVSAPRRALEEAAFLAKAQQQLVQNTNPSKATERFQTEYAAYASKVVCTHSRALPQSAAAPVWFGKYSEFTHPIEHQRRGGAHKDETGIRHTE